MIHVSRQQMASVSPGIDIVEMLAPTPHMTFLRPSDHHSQLREWYEVCVGHRSLSAARDRQPRND
jgi:hypothetical protein